MKHEKLINGLCLFLPAVGVAVVLFGLWSHSRGVENFASKNPVVGALIEQREEVRLKAKTMMLNHLMPEFRSLMEHASGSRDIERAKLMQYQEYYRQVVDTYPGMADAYGLLGFCHAQSGDLDRAVENYRKAGQLNPQFFWYSYNLGMAYAKQGRYRDATMAFSRALQTDPRETLRLTASSKIYQQIIMASNGMNYSFEAALKAGYEDCQKMAALLIHTSQKKGGESLLEGISQAGRFRLF